MHDAHVAERRNPALTMAQATWGGRVSERTIPWVQEGNRPSKISKGRTCRSNERDLIPYFLYFEGGVESGRNSANNHRRFVELLVVGGWRTNYVAGGHLLKFLAR